MDKEAGSEFSLVILKTSSDYLVGEKSGRFELPHALGIGYHNFLCLQTRKVITPRSREFPTMMSLKKKLDWSAGVNESFSVDKVLFVVYLLNMASVLTGIRFFIKFVAILYRTFTRHNLT